MRLKNHTIYMHPVASVGLNIVIFIAIWCYLWSPYRQFRNVRLLQLKEAQVYIREHCVNKADIRVQVGDLDKCPLAMARAESSANYDAWEDLMQSYNICPRGSCLVFSMNIFNLVGYACAFVAVLFICFAGLSVFNCLSGAWTNFAGKTMLPYSMKDSKKMF